MKQLLLTINDRFSSCESLINIISKGAGIAEKQKEEVRGYNEDDDEFISDDRAIYYKKEEHNMQTYEIDEDQGFKFKRISCRIISS